MEETINHAPRLSRWSSLFFGLILALILTTFVAQVFSADGPEGEPPVPPGDEAEGQAVVTGTETEISQSGELTPTVTLTPTVVLTLTTPFTPTQMYTTYIPTIFQNLEVSVSRPNSNNQWRVSWNGSGTGITYQIQESQDPNFATLVSDATTNNTAKDFQHGASFNNSYYYRVRINQSGPNVQWAYAQVNGAYRDDFDDRSSGWDVRRMSFKEKTDVKYGQGDQDGYLIAIVFDKFDWLVGSPMAKAPEVPYVIEYRSQVHEGSNLVSGGIAVGGDWNGQPCPEIGNVYGTDNCFNHFYDFNYIYHPQLTLLFERVDRLYWCPACGGSQVKRLGDIGKTWPAFEVLDSGASKGWHDYRVEVREDGLHLSIDGRFVRSFFDTNYINDPYFGVFASTYEYEPSIWLYDYYKVTPLD